MNYIVRAQREEVSHHGHWAEGSISVIYHECETLKAAEAWAKILRKRGAKVTIYQAF